MNIIRLSIRRPIFVSMIAIFLAVVGSLALLRLPIDLYPNVTYPVLAVRSSLNGAAPEEMESLVTKRIEDVLSTIPGVKTIRSISREGSSIVILEFDVDADIKYQETQVRAKVANMRKSLPDELSEPVVYRQDPDDTPIIEISLTGNRSASELSDIAENNVAKPIRQIEGVGEVDLSGERLPEVRVALNPQVTEALRINASDVVASIAKVNRNDPIGNLEGKESQWLLRATAQATSPFDLRDIPVSQTAQGTPIYLKDIAKIESAFQDVSRVSLYSEGQGLQPAVLVGILKQSGENTLSISNKIKAILPAIEASLPADVHLRITQDTSDLVRSNVHDVFESLIVAALLTVSVVLLFLRSPRSTLTTGLALPSSVITTFLIMAAAGFTINLMTLLALSLSIGLLVDDAIVVRENIFRHLHKERRSGHEAAEIGTREVALAVTATTLTVVAIFMPVAGLGGVIGQFFKPFALTVVFAMIVSLWDALTMAPLLSAHFANVANPSDEWKPLGRIGGYIDTALLRFESIFDVLAKWYERLLRYVVARGWIAAAIAVLSVGLSVLGFAVVKKGFIPSQLGDTFSVSLDGPIAVPLSRVTALTGRVDALLSQNKDLDSWTMTSRLGFSGNANISLTVRIKQLVASSQPALAKIRDDVRRMLSKFPGYDVRISEPADPLARAGSGRFQPIVVNLFGDDPNTMTRLTNEIVQMMRGSPGVTDVSAPQEGGLPELRFKYDPLVAAHYGVSPQLVSDTMRTWIEGDSSNTLKRGDDQIPIRVFVEGADKESPEALARRLLHVKGAGNKITSVPVGNVTTRNVETGPTTISRENRQRIQRVSAGIATGASLSDVNEALTERLNSIPLPSGYSINTTGQSTQMSDLFHDIVFSLLLGFVFVYMVLASLFESYVHPLTVMSAIPLAASGAVFALLITNTQLDLYGGIGMILLAGIVAKNSILLVDFAIEKVRATGMDAREAILSTAPLRLRPILMTSVAMIVGMLPVALGIGASGEARMSLGIATIGGVLSSTFLTLLVVPNLFIFVQKRVIERVKRVRGRGKTSP